MSSVEDETELTIAIVGGGVSGLYAAWLLAQSLPVAAASGRIILFETSERLGGRIETVDFSDLGSYEDQGTKDQCRCGHLIAEFGPMRFEEPVQDRFRALCEALHVERRDFAAHRGEDVSFPRYQLFDSEKYGPNELGSLDLFKLGILRLMRAINRNRNKDTHPDAIPCMDALEDLRAECVFRVSPEGGLTLRPAYAQWFQQCNEATYRYLRQDGRVNGAYLHQLGFWNALASFLSHQAVMKIRDLGTFYHLLPHNPNAAEWTIFWLRALGLPPGESLKQIVGGSARLVSTLINELTAGVDIRILQEVISVLPAKNSRQVTLHVRDKTEPHDPIYEVTADHVILALPAGAIRELSGAFPIRIRRHMDSVIGFPLMKGFLVTADPWWDELERPQTGAGRVPTRELHYYTEKLGRTSDGSDGRMAVRGVSSALGMVMMYTDHPADEFWRALMAVDRVHDRADVFLKAGRRIQALGSENRGVRELSVGDGAQELDENPSLMHTMLTYLMDDAQPLDQADWTQVAECLPTLLSDQRMPAWLETKKAIEAAEQDWRAAILQASLRLKERQQLCEALTAKGYVRAARVVSEADSESVQAFAIRDWSRPPFWAGCHVWKPGARSWEALDELAAFGLVGSKDVPNCHVCGEAYSDYQGFIEGALRSAESVVRRIVGASTLERVRPADVDLGARVHVRPDSKCRVCSPGDGT